MNDAMVDQRGGFARRFAALTGRDVTLGLRGGGGWFHALFFFLVFVGLAGFALGPAQEALATAAAAIVWLGVSLALQFAAVNLFREDLDDGTLGVEAAEQESLAAYLAAKIAAAFFLIALPMAALLPVVFVLFAIPPGLAVRASMIVIAAIPLLVLANIVAAALTAGLRAGGLLAAGLSAPLLVPVLIFGISATEIMILETRWATFELLLLGALTMFYAAVLPPFVLLALRLGLE